MGEYTKEQSAKRTPRERDTRSFNEKYGKPLDRSKYKFQAKKTTVKAVTAAQQRRLSDYEKVKREKWPEGFRTCESCGSSSDGISCSHIVSRAEAPSLYSYPKNLLAQCHRCHQLTEEMKFWQLENGLRIMELLCDSLGGIGQQKFWKMLYKYDGMNLNLWRQSQFYNKEIHEE